MVLKFQKALQIKWWRWRYREGMTLSRFVACDVRRDIKVIDVSEIAEGYITILTRTWNVLYASKGIAPEPTFGKPVRVRIEQLWKWNGSSWDGPVNDE